MKQTIITLAIISTVLAFCLLHARDQLNTQDRYIEQQRLYIQKLEKLPSASDIQQRLVDLGYALKVDGICGIRTITAWDTEVHSQMAAKYMTETGAPK